MKRVWQCSIWGAVALSGSGCAGAAQRAKPVQTATTSRPADKDGGEAHESNEAKKKPPVLAADVLYARHRAVPPLSQECTAAPALGPQTKCLTSQADLADALAFIDGRRDQALAKLERCEEFQRGMIRALRAELGSAECADALVEKVVGEEARLTKIPSDIRETLVALGLGARLRRLAVNPPIAPKSHKKVDLEDYFKKDLFPWVGAQAQAIFLMASQGTHLSGYARGVVAIEAGNADMRFVELVREAPIADEFSEDSEARDLYYATLDERLEGRKIRGRNACLVGLREMARVGVRNSERVASARLLLSNAYGGRRINALDTLLLADVPSQKAESDGAAIASRVPTAYASSLVASAKFGPNLVRAHLQMGMTLGLRRQVESSSDSDSLLLLARALFESGRSYFRAEDFQGSFSILNRLLDDKASAGELSVEQLNEARLVRALSVALLAGPKDAAQMMVQGPRFADALGNLSLLDGLALEKSVLGGMAQFNAAYLRELVAPSGTPDYWKDLSARYQGAAQKLKGNVRRLAKERGDACRQIEKTLRINAKK